MVEYNTREEKSVVVYIRCRGTARYAKTRHPLCSVCFYLKVQSIVLKSKPLCYYFHVSGFVATNEHQKAFAL